MKYFLIFLLTSCGPEDVRSGLSYTGCTRQWCEALNDRQTNFQFDQPELLKVEGEILSELGKTSDWY